MKKLKYSWFILLCWCLLYSSYSTIHTYTLFFSFFFHYGFCQEIECSSLCYTGGGPCCLSILNVIVCIYQPQTPSPLICLPSPPLGNHKSVVYFCVIFIELTIILFVSLFFVPCINLFENGHLEGRSLIPRVWTTVWLHPAQASATPGQTLLHFQSPLFPEAYSCWCLTENNKIL